MSGTLEDTAKKRKGTPAVTPVAEPETNPEPETRPEPEDEIYTLTGRDSAAQIAQARYGTQEVLPLLAVANPHILALTETLRVGQHLLLPAVLSSEDNDYPRID